MILSGQWLDLNGEREILSEETIKCLEKIGFPSMTPVQKSVIPLLLGYKDVAAEAVTGSGKTLAFLVPAMEYIRNNGGGEVSVVILVPTRELAKQLFDVASKISDVVKKFVPQYCIGGNQVFEDIEKFNRIQPSILIGTPGKLHEFMMSLPENTFKKVALFVIDEADQILKMGLGATITSIFECLPKQRRTGLFSATMNSGLHEVIRTGMRNPMFIRIKSNESQAPAELINFYAVIDPKYRFAQLIHFIRSNLLESKAIIFVLNRQEVDFMYETINISLEKKISIFPIHGKMPQKDRGINLNNFRMSDTGILLSTDVSARGIDIPDIEWIIQYDAPQDPSMFVHRIGRTARIGNSGNAIIFLRDHEDAYIDFISSDERITMQEMKIDVPGDADCIINNIRAAISSNEELYLLSMKAVVGYVRSYGEHKLKLLMRLKELDIVALAEGFGLIRLPGMPELRTPTYKNRVEEYNSSTKDLWEKYDQKDYKITDFGGVPERNKKKAPPKHVQQYQKKTFVKARH